MENLAIASSLKTQALVREFYYNGVRIPDPASAMTVEEVREFLPPTYPSDRPVVQYSQPLWRLSL